MLLQDFLDYLAFGELSQHSVGTDNEGKISQKDYPKILTFINLGLTKIHTKLPLRRKKLSLITSAERSSYILSEEYAVSKAGEWGYILDGAEPFQDDVLVIEQLFNSKDEELDINDTEAERVVTMPTFNELKFAVPEDEVMTVGYRANHPRIPISLKLDPMKTHIHIPDWVIEPLCTYIVAKLLAARSNTDGVQLGSVAMGRFNKQIEEIKSDGLIQLDLPKTKDIRCDGWR